MRTLTAGMALAAACALCLPGWRAQAGCGLPYRPYYPTFSYPSVSYSLPSYSAPVTYAEPYYTTRVEEVTKVITQPIIVPATLFQYLPAYGIQAVGVQQGGVTQGFQAQAQGVQAQAVGGVQAVGLQQGAVQAVQPQGQAPTQSPPPPQGGTQVELPVALDLPAASASPDQPAPSGQAAPTQLPTAQSPPPPAGTPSPAADVTAALMTRCASCHTGAASERGFQIFSGGNQLASLTPLQKGRIALRSRRATMPPAAKGDTRSPAACTNEECDAIDAWAEK